MASNGVHTKFQLFHTTFQTPSNKHARHEQFFHYDVTKLRRSRPVRVAAHDHSDVDPRRALARNAHARPDHHEYLLHLAPVGALELDGPGAGHVGLAAEAGTGAAVAGPVLLGGGAPVQVEVLRLLRPPRLLALLQGLFL